MSIFLKSLIPSKSNPPLFTYNNSQEERRRGKNRTWQTEALNIKLERFHGPTKQTWARTISTSEWTWQEANLQVTKLTPWPRLTSQPVKPTLIQVLGIHPCQCLPHCFHASSSRQEWYGVMDVPINCSYLPSFIMKKHASLASPYSFLYRNFQAPNPSLLAQFHPVSLFNGRYHLSILWKSGMVWPLHSSKVEVPSFTQKEWTML